MEKVFRAFTVSIVIFAVIIAVVVGTRIDQNTVSVLSGALIGIITAAPFAAILTFALLRRKGDNTSTPVATSYERSLRSNVPYPQNPPQYWVMPQQFAPTQAQTMLASPAKWPSPDDAYSMRPRRRFYVIGENGEPRMVDEEITEKEAVTEGYEQYGHEPGAAF
ncbi:MAG TPA: hypothetical protein VGK87_05595 [Anaerolineae bacterium]|jgi:hypothetical protein